ncbi:serpin family protein [Endozoicomonas euniceicola]|uniref:Serpin domain-containing protein n=1 Tax=Endozoicomonas euniceicola TaxID=1234143 RepID=A0ABY6GWE9_9GAMM|nr:serpin family protein [Endozoicomonas euniceicola]UYM16995.1 hypothetical protein NX720_03455 [Endozoicomonas euniceicola]
MTDQNMRVVIKPGQPVSEPTLSQLYSGLVNLLLKLQLQALPLDKLLETASKNAEPIVAAAGSNGDDDPDKGFTPPPPELTLIISGNELPPWSWLPDLYNQSLLQKLELLRRLRQRLQQAITSGQRDLPAILQDRIMIIEADLSNLATNRAEADSNPAFQTLLLAGLQDDTLELLQHEDHTLANQLAQNPTTAGVDPATVISDTSHPASENTALYDDWQASPPGLIYAELKRRLSQLLTKSDANAEALTLLTSNIQLLLQTLRDINHGQLPVRQARGVDPQGKSYKAAVSNSKELASDSAAAGSSQASNNDEQGAGGGGDDGPTPPKKPRHTYSSSCPLCNGEPCHENQATSEPVRGAEAYQPDCPGQLEQQANEIVKHFIDKLSFELLNIRSESSTAISPVSLAPVLGMLLASMENNNDKEDVLSLASGSLTPELESEIHRSLSRFSRTHPFGNNRMVNTINFIASNWPKSNQKLTKILSEAYETQILMANKHKSVEEVADDFIEQKTNGKFTNFFKDISEKNNDEGIDTAIVNLLLFQGSWQNKFDEKNTSRGRFLLADGREVTNVKMMCQPGKYQLAEKNGFSVIKKRFKPDNGDEFSLIAIKAERHGNKTIKMIDQATLENLIKAVNRVRERKINFLLPQIKIESNPINLLSHINDILSTEITPEKLSRLEMKDNSILRIFQEIKASINEKGASVEVVSSANISSRSGTTAIVTETFMINSPTLVIIQDENGIKLISFTINDNEYLVTYGDPEFSTPVQPASTEKTEKTEKPTLSPSSPYQWKKYEPDEQYEQELSGKINKKLNPERDLAITKIELDSTYIDIHVSSKNDAEKLMKRLKETLQTQFHNFLRIYGELTGNIYVEVLFSAKTELIKQLNENY